MTFGLPQASAGTANSMWADITVSAIPYTSNGDRPSARIYHSRAERYTVIPDATVRDSRLSYRARGVLAEILSRPPDWDISADRMWREIQAAGSPAAEGRDAIRAAFNELEQAGYLRRDRQCAGRGKIRTSITVTDQPGVFPQVAPTTAYQASVYQASVNQASKEVPPRSTDTKEDGASARASWHGTATASPRQRGYPPRDQMIAHVQQAITEHYDDDLTDSQCVALWYQLVGNRNPRYPVAYLSKIFAETPDLDTHVANAGDEDDWT